MNASAIRCALDVVLGPHAPDSYWQRKRAARRHRRNRLLARRRR